MNLVTPTASSHHVYNGPHVQDGSAGSLKNYRETAFLLLNECERGCVLGP